MSDFGKGRTEWVKAMCDALANADFDQPPEMGYILVTSDDGAIDPLFTPSRHS